MDAIDILGEILGHKTQKSSRSGKRSGNSRGGSILKDILGRGRSASPAPSTKAAPSAEQIQREALELEALLNVANDRRTRLPSSGQPEPQPSTGRELSVDNDRAMVLVRAMLNAAKADGEIDAGEQEQIMGRFQSADRETTQFLRRELSAPLDLNEFVRSVPIGMEQQVYTMSLMTIDVDTRAETRYLDELSLGLRIPAAVRQQIHQRLGVPD